jgi:hypothetical protein
VNGSIDDGEQSGDEPDNEDDQSEDGVYFPTKSQKAGDVKRRKMYAARKLAKAKAEANGTKMPQAKRGRPATSANENAIKRRKENREKLNHLPKKQVDPLAAKGCGKGNNQPAVYHKGMTVKQRLTFATNANEMIKNHPDVKDLDSREKKIQKAADLLRIGKQFSTLRGWLQPDVYEKLAKSCAENPACLNEEGKHKGGRGNKKAGSQKTLFSKHDPLFPETEALVEKQVVETRRERLKVSTRDIIRWMNTLVGEELRLFTDANTHTNKEDAEYKKELAKLTNFKASRGWLTGFLKRHGFSRRRATNKRFHSAEDLLGDLLGFVRCLRQLRRDNPSDADSVWGLYGLYTTFNCDSVPVPFASSDKSTVEKIGTKRVSIITPGSKLDYRQATLHLTIRPKGPQPWPVLLLRGATTKDGKEDKKKRAAEMEKYKDYHVHVLWQKNAWLDEVITTKHWIPCFKKDLQRLGLTDQQILLMMDNLDAQKTQTFRSILSDMKVKCVYGPKNGTDIWQPVDHGMGQRYQALLDASYVQWTKSTDCLALFRAKTNPSAETIRGLLVQWTHDAYETLEKERAEKEAKQEKTIFEKAFLRTCTLVSANGDDVDDEMRPEGVEQAMKDSTDTFYKQHSIQNFRDLLNCTDGQCAHVPPSLPLPVVSSPNQQLDAEKMQKNFLDLTSSDDERAKLLVKCLQNGMIWAGSSFIEFASKGVPALLSFLSKQTVPTEPGVLPSPAHDIDLYRRKADTQALGKRFVGLSIWKCGDPILKRAVQEHSLVLKSNPVVKLRIDQVNLFSSRMLPSTDIWPNLCAGYENGHLKIEKLWSNRGPPLELTLHNALRIGSHDHPTPTCYVLRRQAMPMYDTEGRFLVDDTYCDGRFRAKLNQRSLSGVVTLHQHWQPGPCIPPTASFELDGRSEPEDDGESEYDESGNGSESEHSDLENRLEGPLLTSALVRDWQPAEGVLSQQERSDALLAQRLTLQSEANPHGESMRNAPPINRQNQVDRPRRRGFTGSYSESTF